MIAILSIIVPVIIFLIVLWTVAAIQRHWIRKEREVPEQAAPRTRVEHRDKPRVCEKCGASGPDVVFVNRLCLNCFETQRERDEASREMARYYRILGCSESDSVQEVKRQYHRKAKEIHPDSLQGRNLSEELMKFHTAEFQKLHEAYTRILEQRAKQG